MRDRSPLNCIRITGQFHQSGKDVLVQLMVRDLNASLSRSEIVQGERTHRRVRSMVGTFADHVQDDRMQQLTGGDFRLPIGTVQRQIDDSREKQIEMKDRFDIVQGQGEGQMVIVVPGESLSDELPSPVSQ